MFCNNCGNQVAEGSVFCNVCGAQIPQMNYSQPQAPQGPTGPQGPQGPTGPQAPTPAAPQPQAGPAYDPSQSFGTQPQQPQFGQPTAPKVPAVPGGVGFDISGLTSTIAADKLSLLTLIGAALVFLSTLIPAWVTIKAFGFKQSYGLWSISAFYVLMALLYLILPLALVAVRFGVLKMGFIEKFKALNYSMFYIPGILLAFFIIISIAILRAVGGDYSGLASCSFGFSWFLALFGIGGIVAEAVIKFLNKQEYYV